MKIRCRVRNSISNYKYHVLIYNSKDELVLDSYTNEYGELDAKLRYGLYKITVNGYVFLTPKICKRAFIVSKCACNTMLITFTDVRNIYIIPYKKIVLFDENYSNLPIEKGEILLWQKNSI